VGFGDDRRPLKYDVFAELAPKVAFEIDTYWAATFGGDPARW